MQNRLFSRHIWQSDDGAISGEPKTHKKIFVIYINLHICTFLKKLYHVICEAYEF